MTAPADIALSDESGDGHVWNTLLRRILATAGEDRDLRTFLREVARLVTETTAADACFVHVVDRDAGELVLMGATPEEFDTLAGTIRLPLGVGVAGWVAANGRPTVIADKWRDPRYKYIPALRGEDYSSLVSVPLLRPTASVVGVLNVHSHTSGHFDQPIVAQLEEVAGLLAGFVEGAVLLDRLQRREAELEGFAARTVELQELDRRRIAGDIHDGISQRLVSAWYHVRAAMASACDPATEADLAAASDLLSEALEDSRRAITGLRPTLLDDLGLTAALTSVAASIPGVDVEVDLADCHLAPHAETALFRIVQEALHNVVKHAGATRAVVRMATELDRIVVSVTDNGCGFDPGAVAGPASYGLVGMHERATLLGGRLSFETPAPGGTRVVVSLPARPAATPVA